MSTRRAAAVVLAVAGATMTAACAGGSPVSSPASAHPAAGSASVRAGAGGAAGAPPAVSAAYPSVSAAYPPVFAASLALVPGKTGGSPGERIALLSSRTGQVLRWLTPRRAGVYDTALNVRDGWVYFLRSAASGPSGTWRVRVTGGPAQLVQAGYSDYAVSPDGRAAAYVISVDHRDVIDLVARNLVTGRQNTIVMATRPDPDANNWPPGIPSLTWAPDDVHLAVQFELTAAINSVLVFDAFTAATKGDGRTAPTPCPAADDFCAAIDPAYLASGALTYIVQRLARSGATSDSLVAWRAGRLTTLLAFPAGLSPFYDMTAQGQAIWADGPAGTKPSWTIWRWSGGAPVKIIALSPYHGVGPIAW